MVVQLAKEKHYWMEILRRIVTVISFLAERGLPFRAWGLTGTRRFVQLKIFGLSLACCKVRSISK